MLNAYGGVPPPPPRYASSIVSGVNTIMGGGEMTIPKSSYNAKDNLFLSIWRESVAVLFIALLSISVLFSAFTICYYAQRNKAVYEELIDYIDKTVSISKINYNPALGLYEIRSEEFETINELRKYKSEIWTFLLSDLICYVFFIVALFIYFASNLTRTSIRFLFWLFLGIGAFYSLAEVGIFTVIIFPQSQILPNATEKLLDHAVPHNTGGLMQMEHRLNCIFNQNLYNLFKRRQNNGNTCDPYIIGSFITQTLLILFCVCRITSALIFTALAALRNPIGDAVVTLIIKMRPKPRYKNRYQKNPKKSSNYKTDFLHTPKATTFGVNEVRNYSSSSVPPSTPPLGQLDHSISYNNAAIFATSGILNAPAILSSSRSSEISKCDVPDIIFKEIQPWDFQLLKHHRNSFSCLQYESTTFIGTAEYLKQFNKDVEKL